VAKVAVSGYVLLWTRIPELIASVEAASRAAPKSVCDKIAVDAKARAPVQTGYLRSSIKSVGLSAGKSAEVRVEAPYAAFVEYGTYKMAAQPFLTPAVEAHKKLFIEEIVAPLQVNMLR
jgi:HK97 gp10 family phage protein